MSISKYGICPVYMNQNLMLIFVHIRHRFVVYNKKTWREVMCLGIVKYRVDVLEALKERGWSTYRLRREKVLAESVIQQIRRGDLVSQEKLARLCEMLSCQPGDLLEYVPDTETEESDS